MSRLLIPLFILIFIVSIPAQSGTQVAATKCHAFQTVVGKTYLISVAPKSNSDVVLGIGFNPGLPMTVINDQRVGLSETYKMEATSKELQVCVYLNQKDAEHTFVVLGDDQKFPYFMWTADSTVTLETDNEGYIISFRFYWKQMYAIATKASAEANGTQVIAAKSGISYTFNTTPGVPLDFLLVPETNHINLAVHADIGDGYEVVDYDRAASDISETNGGQVEYFQVYPTKSEMTIVVANESSFGGRFKMAVRKLDKTGPSIIPASWRYMDPSGLKQFVDATRIGLPLISETQAVTFELAPSRLTEKYVFAAYALEPGLEFALIIRTDPNKPPLFVQAGGESRRSAPFWWNVIDGEVFISESNGFHGFSSEKLAGFPTRGKIQISIVSYIGSGRVGVYYKDAERIMPLDLPVHRNSARAEVMALFYATYDSFHLIQSNFRLYRFDAVDGESYNVKVIPDAYFDAVIMDPSGRTTEKPTSLELVDENGRGSAENLEVIAHGGLIEFAVAGTRYVHGIVNRDNKRLGGTGYFKYEVTDREGNTPRLHEAVEVALPNEFVSKELNLIYQPWDPILVNESSKYPPFPAVYDNRILEMIGNP